MYTFVTKIGMQKILVILWLDWNPITLVLIWKVLRQAFRWYHYFWDPSTFGWVIIKLKSDITFWNFLKIPSVLKELKLLLYDLSYVSSYGGRMTIIREFPECYMNVKMNGCIINHVNLWVLVILRLFIPQASQPLEMADQLLFLRTNMWFCVHIAHEYLHLVHNQKEQKVEWLCE
jgi:hypothetical protein